MEKKDESLEQSDIPECLDNKSQFRRSTTIFLLGVVTIGLIAVIILAVMGINVTQVVLAFGTYTTFAAAVIGVNLATKPLQSTRTYTKPRQR